MHKSRSNRKANQARRDRQAERQRPLPLADQREIAEARLRERHEEYGRQGPEYAHPAYNYKPRPKGPSFSKIVKEMGIDALVFLPLLKLAQQARKAV